MRKKVYIYFDILSYLHFRWESTLHSAMYFVQAERNKKIARLNCIEREKTASSVSTIYCTQASFGQSLENNCICDVFVRFGWTDKRKNEKLFSLKKIDIRPIQADSFTRVTLYHSINELQNAQIE